MKEYFRAKALRTSLGFFKIPCNAMKRVEAMLFITDKSSGGRSGDYQRLIASISRRRFLSGISRILALFCFSGLQFVFYLGIVSTSKMKLDVCHRRLYNAVPS
jgi:hypothetical protein